MHSFSCLLQQRDTFLGSVGDRGQDCDFGLVCKTHFELQCGFFPRHARTDNNCALCRAEEPVLNQCRKFGTFCCFRIATLTLILQTPSFLSVGTGFWISRFRSLSLKNGITFHSKYLQILLFKEKGALRPKNGSWKSL